MIRSSFLIIILMVAASCAHFETRKAAIYGRAMTDIEVKVRVLDTRWTAKGCAVLEVGDPTLRVLRLPPDARWCARLDSVFAVPVVAGDPAVCSVCLPPLPDGAPAPVPLEGLSDAEVEEILVPPSGGD